MSKESALAEEERGGCELTRFSAKSEKRSSEARTESIWSMTSPRLNVTSIPVSRRSSKRHGADLRESCATY